MLICFAYWLSEKANAISSAYRSIHPSHLGRVDVDSSSNSDPGVSGTICPLATLYDGHFIEYEEPSTWDIQVGKVIDAMRAAQSKQTMYRLIDKPENKTLNESVEAMKNLLSIPMQSIANEEYIDGYDLFGDGYIFWLREDE